MAFHFPFATAPHPREGFSLFCLVMREYSYISACLEIIPQLDFDLGQTQGHGKIDPDVCRV